MPIRPLHLAALGAALAASLGAFAPQVTAQSRAANTHAGTLSVPVNKSQVVSADRAIAKALVGNSDIADVLPITDRSLYVLGKKMGTTSLTLYDAGGRVIAIMDIAVGPDVEALREQLHDLVPDQPIEARISNESIVLTGLVSDPGALDRAVKLARTYAGDKVVNLISMGSSQQVMLEVRFSEVSRNSGFDVGVTHSASDGTFNSISGAGAQVIPGVAGSAYTAPGLNGATSQSFAPDRLAVSAISGSFGIFMKSFGLGGLNINSQLNALETRGMAKTLAQPTLIAMSGQRASFLAGGEFPVPVAQSGNGTGTGGQAITVEFKPFGVSLGFTPTVLGDKTISLLVEPEVSAIDPTASFTLGNITIPGLRTRRASTTLELRDGESFAIAGLLQRDFKTTVSQLPLLGSLPIIGSLFRSSSFAKGETELLIVVTPHLVAPIKPSQVHLPTDAVKDPTPAELIFMGTSGAAQSLPPGPPIAVVPSSGTLAANGLKSTKPSQELPPSTSVSEPTKAPTGEHYAY